MSAVCRCFRVTGRVQGVFFRETTKQQAERLALTGHALNCADGSVEVLACGNSSQVEALADWLWQGPAMAQVTQVEVLASGAEAPLGFSTGWQ